MKNRASVWNLLLSVATFLVFMVLLLAALAGFGVGAPELLIWLVLVIVGLGLLVRRHRDAGARQPDLAP